MNLSLSDIKQVRNTLKRAPPPRAPVSPSTDQNGGNNDAVSVESVRQRFEQKRVPPQKLNSTPSPSQDHGKPTEEKVLSVASARAKFEQNQKPVNRVPPHWKQSDGNQSKTGLLRLDKNSNASGHKNMEPPRKELPNVYRIGAAPPKPAKPKNLRFMLRKYKDKIVLSKCLTTSIQASTKDDKYEDTEEIYDDTEELYDDVESVQPRNGDDQSDDIYEAV